MGKILHFFFTFFEPFSNVVVLAGHSALLSWPEGAEVEDDCGPGWLRVGGEAGRTCGEDGRWSDFNLKCGE